MAHSDKRQWDEYVDSSVFAYNTSNHESTHYTPFEVMFGRKATLPVDIAYAHTSDTSNQSLQRLLMHHENTIGRIFSVIYLSVRM